MFIRLDVFANLLRIRPGELLHAARTDGLLDGMPLPARRHVRGAAVMFYQAEAIAFSEKWHARKPSPPPVASGEPLIPLSIFAEQAGIIPLELWQAVKRGKKILGITLPVPVKDCKGQLMFEPAAVRQFVQSYHKTMRRKV